MKFTISPPIWIHEIGMRANQEDGLYPLENNVSSEDKTFILCDGMGGHDAGEVASAVVCESLGKWFQKHVSSNEIITESIFNKALAATYIDLDAHDNMASVRKMGTTMAFLMFHIGGVTIAHMGDSRVYQLRPGETKPRFKTKDHSLVNDLVRLGEITEDEARVSPNRNVITRAMQPGLEHRAKADISVLTDIKAGDWFYLCSDGMLENMNDEEIISIITDDSLTNEQKRDELVRRTAYNKDNHSAWLIQVAKVEDSSEGTDVNEEAYSNHTEREAAIASKDAKERRHLTEKTTSGKKKNKDKRFIWTIILAALIFLIICFIIRIIPR